MRVISARMRHGTWRNPKTKRHDEGDPGFGHDDEFLLRLRSVQFETFREDSRPRAPVADWSNLITLPLSLRLCRSE